MTAQFPPEAALVASHKRLAQRLLDSLRSSAPQVGLTHVQALHVVAALHGMPNWQTLLARPHRSRLPDTPALQALARALEQRGTFLSPQALTQVLGSLTPLTCTIADEDVEDMPIKTQLALSLVLQGPITPGPLESLLWAEFDRVCAIGGFRYHAHPTSIFIWAYPSEAHHQAGAGQWAGMLQRSHHDFETGTAPRVTLNEDLIRVVQEPEIERFGLSEAMRRILFLDHCRVTNRARIAADQAHPIGYENTRESMRLNTEFKRARLEGWNALLAAQQGLTEEQFDGIVLEGMVRSWPMASIRDVITKTIA